MSYTCIRGHPIAGGWPGEDIETVTNSVPAPGQKVTMKSILDPSFRYVNSQKTDIRRTFARVRRQLKEAENPVKQHLAAPVSLLLFRGSAKSS